MDCSRFSRFRWAWIARFSLVVGWTVRSCGYGMFCYGLSLRLPLTAPFLPISYGASPFHQLGWAEPYCKKAFVRFELLMIWYFMPLSAKEATQPQLAQILRKATAKTPCSRRNEQSFPPIMKNERPTAQQNLLKRVRYRPEHSQLHQIPNWGVSICTGFQLPILPQTRGSNNTPPQRIPPGG